jgi:hypothetical protein
MISRASAPATKTAKPAAVRAQRTREDSWRPSSISSSDLSMHTAEDLTAVTAELNNPAAQDPRLGHPC